MKIRSIVENKFKAFMVAKEETDFVNNDGVITVRDVKYYTIPNLLEAQMEKVNKAWRFYSKKFVQNPAISSATSKMASSGDINISGNLKVLLDMKEQMEEYKEKRDLDGMIMTMRTMYAMLCQLGYKRGPHAADEYSDVKMIDQSKLILRKYKIIE